MAAYIADGARVDGSWELTIYVTDLDVEKTLRVKGDLHVGGLMVKLVEKLDISMDWSDHGLWWPAKKTWLLRARTTLDQYNVQADAKLQFTPQHKNLKVQLPDLQVVELRVNFSNKCFRAVVETCRELGIRHPEELSFQRKWDRDALKKIAKDEQKRKKRGDPDINDPITANGTHHNSHNSLDGGRSPYPSRSPVGPSPTSTLARSTTSLSYSTLVRSPNNLSSSISGYSSFNGVLSPGSMHSLSFESCMESTLANSPPVPAKEAFLHLHKPKTYADRARINCAWLDSSSSLMEQGIQENEYIMLKFKFFSFYDLNPKYDLIRINQIYEQAKWSLISEEVECTEHETLVFAALQLQVQLSASEPQQSLDTSMNDTHQPEDDEVGDLLKDLQESLEGGSGAASHGDITHIPELCDYVRFLKPRKLTLKSYKRYYAVFRDTFITFYRSQEEAQGPPLFPRVDVKGCEAQPDVHLSHHKYGIKLFVPEGEGMTEIYLRFEKEEQYCKWMAACKLASKGKTMADSSYEVEVKALENFLAMQQLTLQEQSSAPKTPLTPEEVSIQPDDFVSTKTMKKYKSSKLIGKILEAHSTVRNYSLVEAKLAYIRNWQALSNYGLTYFRIQLQNNSKKEELVAIAFDRINLVDIHNGNSLKTWRYGDLKSWHVNWDLKNLNLDFANETIKLGPMEVSCKTIHEFIGGYIFLSMRSGDKNQSLNEQLFYKLTGGWNE